MKERPILFNAPMVRALLDSSKTQTRRIAPIADLNIKQHSSDMVTWGVSFSKPVKGVLGSYSGGKLSDLQARSIIASMFCPYGQPGDRLWVRETWARTAVWPAAEMVVYREGDNRTDYGGPWKPGIHMFRRDSRITLEIVSVRVERLQEISETDAIAEGCTKNHNGYFWGGPHKEYGLKQMSTPTKAYRDLWESINGPGSWAANPWVWAIEFRRLL